MLLRSIILFCGLSMDSCIEIMEKGATLKKVGWKENILYPLIFALINIILLLVGYFLVDILTWILAISAVYIIAIVILMCEGVYFLKKGTVKRDFFDCLDKNFNYQTCIKKAFLTSIDNFLAGISLGLIGVNINLVIFIIFLLHFGIYALAIKIGYVYGARWQRCLAIIEGVCLIVYAIFKLVGLGLW